MTLPTRLPSWTQFQPGSGFARNLLSVYGTDCTVAGGETVKVIIRPGIELMESPTAPGGGTGAVVEKATYTGWIPYDVAERVNLSKGANLAAPGPVNYNIVRIGRNVNGWLRLEIQA